MSSDSDTTNPSGPVAGQAAPPSARQREIIDLLRRGETAARAGRRTEARFYFRTILTLDENVEDAWLWLGYLAPTLRQSLDYLQQARQRHPASRRVREAIAWVKECRPADDAGPSPLPEANARPSPPPAQTVTIPDPPPAQTVTAPGAPPATQPMPEFKAKPAQPSPQARLPLVPAMVGLGVVSVAIIAVLISVALNRPGAPAPLPEPSPCPAPTTVSEDMAALREAASAAIERGDWDETITLLERMSALSPNDDGVRQQVAVAHLRRGLELADQGFLDEAIAHYDAAIRFYANDVDLQTARRLAIGYRDGRLALEEQRWQDAVALLQPVYELAPGFRDVGDLLYNAYIQEAAGLEAGQELEAARKVYADAVALRPDAPEAQERLAAITAILTPPTPTPTPRPSKRIVIDLSEQRFRAYENDALVFDWVCSTGEPGRPTRVGEFSVLDKIPEAWSSVWGLRMPYWLGIYWAGGSENGIHALPINRYGQQVWAGFLGTRISYGCVILDVPNAAQLYDWVEIGTPVSIVE